MKIFIFNLCQTPIKALHPAWIRSLCQFDISARLAKKQGNDVEHFRYVDDTSMQVAKFVSVFPTVKLPETNIGDFLGSLYIEANKQYKQEDAAKAKLVLESGVTPKDILLANIAEQENYFAAMNLHPGPTFWESSLLAEAGNFLQVLETMGILLDYEPAGGDILLDATEDNLKPIALKKSTGYTFLFKCLLYLYKQTAACDYVLLQCTDEDTYITKYMAWFLTRLGRNNAALTAARIKLNGTSASSRLSGLGDFTFSKIYENFKGFDIADFRVGLRLYVLGQYDDMTKFNFDLAELKKAVILALKIRKFLQPYKTKANANHALPRIFSRLTTVEILAKPSLAVKAFKEIYGLTKKEAGAGADVVNEGLIYLTEVLGG